MLVIRYVALILLYPILAYQNTCTPYGGEITLQVINNIPSIVYVISPDHANSAGELIPDLPEQCPFSDDEHCEINVDHQRERKTGPCIPLSVMRCKKHGSFTLYPPGYYPHSRHALAQVDMEGNPLTKSEDNNSLLTGTLFDAASDAADGIQWQIRSNDGLLKPRFITQLRHIQRAAILLGIDPDTEQYLREETAQILSIPGQHLSDAIRKTILCIHEYQSYGREICHILQCIPVGMLFERLAEAGAGAGLWPTPLFFRNNMLQKSSFHRVRMRASP